MSDSFFDQTTGKYACPCCGYATLSGADEDDICQVCFWHDDGQDDPHADEEWGGPNSMSLSVARRNFLTIGAVDVPWIAHVREPRPGERRLRVFELEGEKVVERITPS